jgi:hypothetical protein
MSSNDVDGMQMATAEERFIYDNFGSTVAGQLLVVFAFAASTVWGFLSKYPGAHDAGVFFFVGTLFWVYMAGTVVLYSSDISVGPVGISLILHGKVWKTSDWSRIERFRLRAGVNGRNFSRIRQIYIDIRGDGIFSWNIRFDENSRLGYEILIKLLNAYIDRYHIPVQSEIPGDKGPRTHLY